jgi:hypothetical protein
MQLIRRRPNDRRQLAPRVLVVSDQWGYGTTTMGMAVGAELDGQVERVFAGSGPCYELARHFPYESLVEIDTMAEPVSAALDRLIASCQAVVSVMNGPVARRAAERGIPCLYLDCLLWMGAPPPNVPPSVRYLHEAFPGTAARLQLLGSRSCEPDLVGPIVTRNACRSIARPESVLVNFGGLSCVMLSPHTLLAYAETMAHCAVQALRSWDGRIVIAAGRHVLDELDGDALHAIHPRVHLADLDHDAYLAELRRSRALISSAGMHAFYEACAAGVPFVGLPAQNSSQGPALRALQRAGAAQPFDWDRIYGLSDLDQRDQVRLHRRIAGAIHRFQDDTSARMRLVRHLRQALDGRRLARLQEVQAKFFAAQGPLGAPQVADRVRELIEASYPALPSPVEV